MPDAPQPTQAERDAALLLRIYQTDPEIRRSIQRKVKKENPAASFPELDVDDAVTAATKTFGERLEKTDEQLTTTRLELARQKKREAWAKKGLNPDEVERVIDQYGLTGSKDLPIEDAAVRILNAEAVTAAGSNENIRDQGRMRMDDAWGKIANKSDTVINNFAQDEAHKAIDELIKSRRQQGGFQTTPLLGRRTA